MDLIFDRKNIVELDSKEFIISHLRIVYENYLQKNQNGRSLSTIYYGKVTEDAIRLNFKDVSEMKPVKIVQEKILIDSSILPDIQIKHFITKIGRVAISEYGDVLLTNKTAKDIITKKHGFNELKAWGVSALKEVVEQGKAIFYKNSYKGSKNARLDIAAPIKIARGEYKGNYIMAVAVIVSSTTNRASLFELAIQKENPLDATFDNKVCTHGSDSPSMLTLLQQVIEVKNGTRTLDQVTAIGIDS